MKNIRDSIIINAPASKVWEAIKDPKVNPKWHPYVTHIGGEHVLGAKRTCTAEVDGKAGTTEEQCSVYEDGHKIMWEIQKDSTGFSNMVADWSAGFTLESKDAKTTIVMAQSLFRPKKFLVHFMMPMINYKFHQVQRRILGGLKEYAEKK